MQPIPILIPTFNRAKDLAENLRQLVAQLAEHGLTHRFELWISDNASTDDTQATVAHFAAHDKPAELVLNYHRQPENIGLEPNLFDILRRASDAGAEYVLYLGDDDYLPPGYLPFVLETLERYPTLGVLFPGMMTVDGNGREHLARRENFTERYCPPGFDAVLALSHLGHQLSGVVLRVEGLVQAYLRKPEARNMYLIISYAADRLLEFGGLYVPGRIVRVSVGNAKAWSYDKAGYLPEVAKAYMIVDDRLRGDQLTTLMVYFTGRQTWRFGIEPWKPFRSLARLRWLFRQLPPWPGLRQKLRWLYIKDYGNRLLGRVK